MLHINQLHPNVFTDLNDVIQAAEGPDGLSEHFDRIMDYFLRADSREEEAQKAEQLFRFFESLDLNRQTDFLERFLFVVFDDRELAHEPAIIQIRKKISEIGGFDVPQNAREAVRMTDNIHFRNDKLAGRKFIPPLISYLRSNEQGIRRFIGQLEHKHPQKARRILKAIVSELFKSLPPSARLAA